MRILILITMMFLFSCEDSNKQDSLYWSPPELYVCRENSRKNCDCCKVDQHESAETCARGYESDRVFMPCVDAVELEYKVEKYNE